MDAVTHFGLKFLVSWYEMTTLERVTAFRAPTFLRSSVAGQPPCVAQNANHHSRPIILGVGVRNPGPQNLLILFKRTKCGRPFQNGHFIP